jgi:hypothetical protein
LQLIPVPPGPQAGAGNPGATAIPGMTAAFPQASVQPNLAPPAFSQSDLAALAAPVLNTPAQVQPAPAHFNSQGATALGNLPPPISSAVLTGGNTAAPPPFIIDPLTHKPMVVPPGYSLQRNMQDAATHFPDPFWFKNQVQQAEPWNYHGPNDEHLEFHNITNYNYGATGEAWGWPLQVLDRMAGRQQKIDHPGDTNPGNWYGAAPYGDDPNSQIEINQGFTDAKKRSAR